MVQRSCLVSQRVKGHSAPTCSHINSSFQHLLEEAGIFLPASSLDLTAMGLGHELKCLKKKHNRYFKWHTQKKEFNMTVMFNIVGLSWAQVETFHINSHDNTWRFSACRRVLASTCMWDKWGCTCGSVGKRKVMMLVVALTFSLSSGLGLWPSPQSNAYWCHISESLLWREVTRPRSSFNLNCRLAACWPWLSVRFSTTALTRIWRICHQKQQTSISISFVTIRLHLLDCDWLEEVPYQN